MKKSKQKIKLISWDNLSLFFFIGILLYCLSTLIVVDGIYIIETNFIFANIINNGHYILFTSFFIAYHFFIWFILNIFYTYFDNKYSKFLLKIIVLFIGMIFLINTFNNFALGFKYGL